MESLGDPVSAGAPGGADLIERLEELGRSTAAQMRIKRRRLKALFAAGLVVALAVFGALYGLTVQSRALDAETLVQLGRYEVEKRLPVTRQALEDHLSREAPQVVASGLHALLDRLPDLRAYVLRDLTTRFDGIAHDFEAKVGATLADKIHRTKQNLDAAYPELGDRAKLEKLVETVAAEFNRNFEGLTDVLYPQYSAEMDRLSRGIARLHACRPDDLSREDRIKKEIIETMVQLALKETVHE